MAENVISTPGVDIYTLTLYNSYKTFAESVNMEVVAKKKLGSILRWLHDGPEIRQMVHEGVSSYYYKDYSLRAQLPRFNLNFHQLIIPTNLEVDVDGDQMVVTFPNFSLSEWCLPGRELWHWHGIQTTLKWW